LPVTIPRADLEANAPLAIIVLTRESLAMGQRLREAAGGNAHVLILGPACVVGRCEGPALDSEQREPLSPFFSTDTPGVLGWRGPLRRVFPTIWRDHARLLVVADLEFVVRLLGSLTLDRRSDPALVVLDPSARFAIGVLDGRGGQVRAEPLASWSALVLGAQPVIARRTSRQDGRASERE